MSWKFLNEVALKKFYKLLLSLLSVIVLKVVGFRVMQPKEPEYQEKKLSEWMADLSLNPAVVNPAANEALYAMRHQALPIIESNVLNLENVSKAPAWKKRMWDWQMKHGIGVKYTCQPRLKCGTRESGHYFTVQNPR